MATRLLFAYLIIIEMLVVDLCVGVAWHNADMLQAAIQ